MEQGKESMYKEQGEGSLRCNNLSSEKEQRRKLLEKMPKKSNARESEEREGVGQK